MPAKAGHFLSFRSDLRFTRSRVFRLDFLTAVWPGFARPFGNIREGRAFWARRTRRLTRRIFFGINRDQVENSRVPFFDLEVRYSKFLIILLPAAFATRELLASTFGRVGEVFFEIYNLRFWSFSFISVLSILLERWVESRSGSRGLGSELNNIFWLRRKGNLKRIEGRKWDAGRFAFRHLIQ